MIEHLITGLWKALKAGKTSYSFRSISDSVLGSELPHLLSVWGSRFSNSQAIATDLIFVLLSIYIHMVASLYDFRTISLKFPRLSPCTFVKIRRKIYSGFVYYPNGNCIFRGNEICFWMSL